MGKTGKTTMEISSIIEIGIGLILAAFGFILRNLNGRLKDSENSSNKLNDAKNETLQVSIKNIDVGITSLNLRMSKMEENFVTKERFNDFQKACEFNQNRRVTD